MSCTTAVVLPHDYQDHSCHFTVFSPPCLTNHPYQIDPPQSFGGVSIIPSATSIYTHESTLGMSSRYLPEEKQHPRTSNHQHKEDIPLGVHPLHARTNMHPQCFADVTRRGLEQTTGVLSANAVYGRRSILSEAKRSSNGNMIRRMPRVGQTVTPSHEIPLIFRQRLHCTQRL